MTTVDQSRSQDQDFELTARAAAALMNVVEEIRASPLGLYRHLFTDELGNPIIIKWFHEEWNELVLKHQFVLIEGSREITKSSYGLAYTLWRICHNPNLRVKIICAVEGKAIKLLSTIHSFLDAEGSLLRMAFPDIKKTGRDTKRPNSSMMLNLERGIETPEPTVEAVSVLGAGVGARSDLLWWDDVCNESNTILAPSLQPKVLRKLQSDWLNTLTAKGQVIATYNPWTETDAHAWFRKNATGKGGWIHRCYSNGKPGDPFHPIFEERWPREKLIQKRYQIGELHYARGFLCLPFTEDTVAVLPKHLRSINHGNLDQNKLLKAICVLSVDPASGKNLQKGKLDSLGLTALLFVDYTRDFEPTEEQPTPPYPHFEIFVVEALKTKLPLREQFRLIWQIASKWGADHIVCESQAMQDHHEWLLEDQYKWPSLAHVEIHPWLTRNRNKGQRLLNVTHLLNPPKEYPPITYFHPSTVIPNPDPQWITMNNGMRIEVLRDFREQILSFPSVSGDDILDSFTQGASFIQQVLAPRPDSVSQRTGSRMETSVISL